MWGLFFVRTWAYCYPGWFDNRLKFYKFVRNPKFINLLITCL